MTDELRDADSLVDLPEATTESIAKGLEAVSRRRKERQAKRDEYWDGGATEFATEMRSASALNRAAALRGPVAIDAVDHWWAVCVCRWQSLRVKDAELALREYDRHPCSIPLEDDAPMRAQRDLNNHRLVERADGSYGIEKRPASTLIAAVAALRSQVDEAALRGVHEERPTTSTTKQSEDEAAERFALLELK